MGVDELQKPPSVWCPHCAIGRGCKIYDDRPDSCRKFRCLWLNDTRLPDAMRPDKTKVVFHVESDKGRVKANIDPDRPDAWKRGLVWDLICTLRHNGITVLLVCGLKKNLRRAYERETLEDRA